jgi:hypothetical protein
MSEKKKHDAVVPLSVASLTGVIYFVFCVVTGTGNVIVLAVGCVTLASGIFVLNLAAGRDSWGGRIAGAAIAVTAVAVIAFLT